MERNKLTKLIPVIGVLWIFACSNPTYQFILDDEKIVNQFPDIFTHEHREDQDPTHYSFSFYECSKSVNGVIENVLVNTKNDCLDGEPIHGTQTLDVFVHPIEIDGQNVFDYHIYASTQRWEENQPTNTFQGQIIMYRGRSYENDTKVHCTERYVYKPYKNALNSKEVNICFMIDRREEALVVHKIIDFHSNKYGGSKPVEFEMAQFFKIFALPRIH